MAAINNSSQQQQYCLKWNSFHSNMSDVFQNMLVHENLVDVTLACEGASIKAHKMILAACSPYFQNLFMANPCKHPIVILKDVKFNDLKAIIDFIYSGEVNIPQDQLNSLLKTAETLKIKGLADFGEKQLTNTVSLKNNSLPLNYSSFNFNKKRKRPRIQYSLNNNNNLSAISNNSLHKTYSKNANNLTVQQKEVTNGDNGDSSDDDEGNNSSKSASIDKNFFTSANSPSYKNNTNPVQQQPAAFDNDNERDDSEEFEPTKLLEQSMSTPEVRWYYFAHYGLLIKTYTHRIPVLIILPKIMLARYKATKRMVKVNSLSGVICYLLLLLLENSKSFMMDDEYSSNNSNNDLSVLPVGMNSFANQFVNSAGSNNSLNGSGSNVSRTIEGSFISIKTFIYNYNHFCFSI